MRICVTGGAGFVGSHVVDAYLAAGHQVCIVDNLFTGKISNLNPAARFYQVDIVSPGLDEVIRQEKPEAVLHQAARVDVRASMEQPILYAQTNIIGSLNLLESCRRHGVRKIIYAQSGGCIYGEPIELPSPEDHIIQPIDPYGVSKYPMELYLKAYAHQFEIKYTILRYPNVYGPRQDYTGEAGVVSIFARQMLLGAPVIINGSGEQLRDYVYCTDIALANRLALEKGDNEIFNVGSGFPTSVNQLFTMMKEITSYQREAVYGPPRPGEVSASYLNSNKAERELKWKSMVLLCEGLRNTVEFVRTQLKQEGAL